MCLKQNLFFGQTKSNDERSLRLNRIYNIGNYTNKLL